MPINYTVGKCNEWTLVVRGVVGLVLGRLLWPAGLPVAAAVVFLVGFDADVPETIWWTMAPHICLGISTLITARFGFSRAALMSASLWIAGVSLTKIGPYDLNTLAALVALSLVIASALPERGLKSWTTIVSAFPVLGLATFLAWPSGFRAQIDTWLAHLARIAGPDWLHISVGVAAIYAVAAGILLYRMIKAHSPVEGGLLITSGLWLAIIHTTDVTQDVLWVTLGLSMFLMSIESSHALAFMDDLTGLPGRRALERTLQSLTGQYTLAMVDIDRFKKFNDKYGHDAGDEVLRMVAAQLRDVTGGGRAYRYGGEEFTVVFPGRDVSEVTEHLEALRVEIAGHPFVIRSPDRPKAPPKKPKRGKGKGGVKVTVSIGAAERSDKAPDTASVLKNADKKLYQAKRNGRNRLAA